MTQEQLAEKIDISPRALSGIELGEYYPKAETLDKIIEVLNIDAKDLFEHDEVLSNENLYINIIKNLDIIKNNNLKLNIIYKILK